MTVFRRKIDIILVTAFALPFNPLAPLYFFKVGDKFVPEVFFLAYAVFIYLSKSELKHIFKKTVLSQPFVGIFLFLLFLLVLGALRWDTNLLESYARFRSLLGVALGYSIIALLRRSYGERAALDFIRIFLTSAALLFSIALLINVMSPLATKTSLPLFALVILVLVLLVDEKLVVGLLLSVGIALIASLSFFRQNYIYGGLALLTFLQHFMLSSFTIDRSAGKATLGIRRQALLAFLGLLGVLAALPLSIDFVWTFMNSTESRYIQSIAKFNDLISFFNGSGRLGESEFRRAEGLLYFFSNLPFYMLPNGITNDTFFVTWSIWGGEKYSEANIALARDSILAYSLITFGALISFLFFFWGVVFSLICAARETQRSHRALKLGSLLLFGLIVAFDGSAVTQLEKSIYFGITLALAFQRRAPMALQHKSAFVRVFPSLEQTRSPPCQQE